MKNCTHCKYANWNRTKTGKLHPSGHGLCMYEWKCPPLPASMYWGVSFPRAEGPAPLGGVISRKEELKDHCTYFLRSTP